jgi:hypothetical protein
LAGHWHERAAPGLGRQPTDDGDERLCPERLDTASRHPRHQWNLQIVGVPQGSYLLEFINAYGVHHFFETDSSTVDLGWDALGRPDLQTTDVSTTTKFQLDALELTGSSDAFEMTSSNASVSEVLAQPGDVPEGITSFAQSFDWSLRPTYLVDSARADLVFVHQRSTRPDAASGLAYRGVRLGSTPARIRGDERRRPKRGSFTDGSISKRAPLHALESLFVRRLRH